MKIRESGMPDKHIWATFFNPPNILGKLGLSTACNDVVEFGCGYGTFTTTVAHIISGMVYALDIDATMIENTISNAKDSGVDNVQTCLRDFVSVGTGLPDDSIDYAMLLISFILRNHRFCYWLRFWKDKVNIVKRLNDR